MGKVLTVIICVIIAALCVYALISCMKKFKNGCCGGDNVKIKPENTDKAGYAHKTVVYIDGMSCGHCAARVENAFNEKEGCLAEVDLDKKCAVLWSRNIPDENEIRETVEKNGYVFVKSVTEK